MHYSCTSIIFHFLSHVRRRPSVPFALNTSISEGEALLSPGDARWHSVYAAKMSKAGLMGWKSTKSKRKLDPAVETFLDLKNSQDPSSTDSSQLSDDTQKVETYVPLRMHTKLMNVRPNGEV